MRAKAIRKFLKAVALVCQPEGVMIDEIAESLGIDKRSAYRVPKTLDSVGVPIRTYLDDEGKRRITVEDGYKKDFLNLFGFEFEGVDYKADADEMVGIPSIA